MMDLEIPRVAVRLPELYRFACDLARCYQAQQLHDWQDLARRVHAHFTPQRLREVDRVVPGWSAMAAQGDGVTLVHVLAAFAGLLISAEYRAAAPAEQALAEWVVLFHDVAKQTGNGQRDLTHGFRSAAVTAESLGQLGFALPAGPAAAWGARARAALTPQNGSAQSVQDNRQLPALLRELDRWAGAGSPAARLVQAVLLHMSITTLSEWPQAAALTQSQVREMLDPAALPLLEMMMLADCYGWTLFDPLSLEQQLQETRAVFRHLQSLFTQEQIEASGRIA